MTSNTIARLKVAAVAGGANNQLATLEDGAAHAKRGILYAPDYVLNAGGLTHACGEYFGWEKIPVEKRVAGIADRLRQTFEQSKAANLPTNDVADRLARKVFEFPAATTRA